MATEIRESFSPIKSLLKVFRGTQREHGVSTTLEPALHGEQSDIDLDGRLQRNSAEGRTLVEKLVVSQAPHRTTALRLNRALLLPDNPLRRKNMGRDSRTKADSGFKTITTVLMVIGGIAILYFGGLWVLSVIF